jgi:DNA polymerase I-like protein with 3'-5' exonuclease and polymerase domains
MTNQVHDVLTTNQLNTMCQTLTPGTLVAFDVETTGLDPYAHGASVVSLAITTQDETTWVVPLDHPEGPWGFRWRDVLGTIANTLSSCRIIAHNAQFDVRWVTQHTRPSVDLSDAIIIDTLILAHLLNENRSKKLKELAAPLMGGTSWAIEGVARAQSVPWFELSKYNALDTIATMRLAKELVEDSKSQPRVAALHKEIVAPAARALTRVTARGILLDRKMAIECAITAKQESSVAGARLMSTARGYGMDPDAPGVNVSWEPTAKWYRQFMDLAVATGDIVVVETTATGASSWRAGVMKKLAADYPLAGVILAYRHGAKQGQFIRSWQETAGLDGRVHATFNVGRTRTGRLSSSDPNMQQVSRELKHCFTARPGWKFVEIDYSQIELRIIAEFIHRFVEPDNPMLQAYLDDRDLHRENAALVTGGAPEDVSDDDRQSGKAVGFGYCFGMGAAGFVTYAAESYGVDFTLDHATQVRNEYFKRWSGLGEWHNHQRALAKKQGFVENLMGRRRRLPAIYGERSYDQGEAERQAINSPIQATASDLMLFALARIEELPRDEVVVVGTVHDSVLLEVKSAWCIDKVCGLLLESPVQLTVPVAVEASIGDRWGVYEDKFTRSTR